MQGGRKSIHTPVTRYWRNLCSLRIIVIYLPKNKSLISLNFKQSSQQSGDNKQLLDCFGGSTLKRLMKQDIVVLNSHSMIKAFLIIFK